ncbi:MAG: N-acetylneuraminate synthase [Chitinophagaceae bacterium]|nr:N-acetylneuraminate synthase [Chitinophagaceae bacterium]
MIKIQNKEISKQSTPFIIAEVGINHNGDINNAFEMIKVAKKSGVDAVKFQTFKAAEFVADPTQDFTYTSQGETVTESMLDMFKRYEFTEEQWVKIKQKCDEEKIMFLSTPQNKSDLDLLLKIGVSAVKVGSDDFTNIPLLQEYSKSKLPIILSCGMANMAEVYQALESVGFFQGYPVALLLCTSEYPTPPSHVNLLKLRTLRGAFENLVLGFSDHTQGTLASSLAVAMGGVIFEKHFTLDNNLPGPDHWFSENPAGLNDWVKSIRTSYLMLGSNVVSPTEKELENKKEFQRVIVALTDIKKGETFTFENTGMKRIKGGNGLPGIYYKYIINKKALKDYFVGESVFS